MDFCRNLIRENIDIYHDETQFVCDKEIFIIPSSN